MDKPTNNTDQPAAFRVYQISQIGMEMAIPVGIGVGLDLWLKTMPICTIIGAVLGPTLGFIHLMALLKPPGQERKS
jgi:hypothetical protein